MHPFMKKLTAILLVAAFLVGFLHCALDGGCGEDSDGTSSCELCLCHSPVISETAAPMVSPCERVCERIEVSITPNVRLALASIFNPPRA